MSIETATLKFEAEVTALSQEPWLKIVAAVLHKDSFKKILDIGSGIGFVTLAASRRLGRLMHYHLLDKDYLDHPVVTGYHAESSAYNELSATVDLLMDNGLTWQNIHVHNADLPLPEKIIFDFVASNCAWGFHFPIETYYEYVKRTTREGSLLFVTLRNDRGGEAVLAQDFTQIWHRDDLKCVATLWRRK